MLLLRTTTIVASAKTRDVRGIASREKDRLPVLSISLLVNGLVRHNMRVRSRDLNHGS